MTKQLLELVIKSIVSDANSVDVEETHDGGTIFFKVKVKHEDRGRLIGREGRTIRSLRVLAQCSLGAEGKNCLVELVD